jgi:DNA-binding MarR family transcriptional regulator
MPSKRKQTTAVRSGKMVAQALACDKSSQHEKISGANSTGRPARRQANEKPGAAGEAVVREFAPKLAAPGLWFCNWKIWLEARRRLDLVLDPLQLRAREFWLLALAGPGNVSQHEIAELCGLDPSSLVAVLDSMERRGWLRRRRNPRDRRVQWVQRTEAGDRLFSRALPLAQRAEAQQLAVLSAAHQRQLVAAMGKLVMSSK